MLAKFGRSDRKQFSSTWLACKTSLLIQVVAGSATRRSALRTPIASPWGRVVVRINDVEARCKQVIFPINDLVLPNVVGRRLTVVFPANRLDNHVLLCYNVSRISENIILRKNTLWSIGYGQNFLRKGLFEGSQKR